MTVAYAQPQDVYDLGLTAPAFVVRPRALDGRQGDTLTAATGVFSFAAGLGLTATDLVRLVLIAQGGSLPGGASATATYYPLPLNYWQFQLSLTQGGAPVVFSDAGTTSPGGASAWGILVDPERRLQRIALGVSGDIDQDLVAHATPIQPDAAGAYPEKLVGIVARTTARRAIAGLQFENPSHKAAAERVLAEEKRDDEQRAAWRLGQPLLPTPLDLTPSVGDDAARGVNRRTSSATTQRCGWQRGTL